MKRDRAESGLERLAAIAARRVALACFCVVLTTFGYRPACSGVAGF
jgi:hypothetical protein